ncbi:MAG: FAD-dependent monooxygenase [Phyllobacteriaceae bacterium]|nr:FAD-dependent monooxygenase [Phyllobacteriaceae bacterium]
MRRRIADRGRWRAVRPARFAFSGIAPNRPATSRRVTALLDDPAIKRGPRSDRGDDLPPSRHPPRLLSDTGAERPSSTVAISQETGVPDSSAFPARLAQLASAFSPFGAIKDWLAWPLNAVGPKPVWRHGERVAYVGDAAHAVTPFAAQGAAMAIEDAATLARSLNGEKSPANALTRYAAARDPRLARVAKRGAFNHFSWHAAGPMALARDMTLGLLGGRRLAAQLDWLYGHDADAGH